MQFPNSDETMPMGYEMTVRQHDGKYLLWHLMKDPTVETPEDWEPNSENFPKRWVVIGVFDHLLTKIYKEKK